MSARILAIDDDPYNLDLFRMLLQSDGYEVVSSPVAYEQMAEVEALHPDLIILDIRLSRQREGFTFLQELKRSRPIKDIPVIICTADLGFAREQEENLRDKGIPIIHKPFDIDSLLEVVHQSLPSQN